jgi:hypothetical protein
VRVCVDGLPAVLLGLLQREPAAVAEDRGIKECLVLLRLLRGPHGAQDPGHPPGLRGELVEDPLHLAAPGTLPLPDTTSPTTFILTFSLWWWCSTCRST